MSPTGAVLTFVISMIFGSILYVCIDEWRRYRLQKKYLAEQKKQLPDPPRVSTLDAIIRDNDWYKPKKRS